MIQYIEIRYIASCYKVDPNQVISMVRNLDYYEGYLLDEDSLVKYSDALDFYAKIKSKKKRPWKTTNLSLRKYILELSDMYPPKKEKTIYQTLISLLKIKEQLDPE